MNLEITLEESIAIHNAVIFMANDLMEEIQELEKYVKEHENDDESRQLLAQKNRRWEMLVGIAKKLT